MALAEDEDVVETLASDRADEALRERILPRASGSREDFLDLHALHVLAEGVPVDGVAIAEEIGRGGSFAISDRPSSTEAVPRLDHRRRAALRRDRVTAHRIDLGDHGHAKLRVRLGDGDGRAKASASAAHHQHVARQAIVPA